MSAAIEGTHHVGLTVSDLERAVDFWRRFGFELQQRFRFDDAVGTGVAGADYELALLRRANQPLILELIEYHGVARTAPLHNHEVGAAHVALLVANIQQLYEELRQAGVEFVSAPRRQDDSGVIWVYAKDPDGITVELLELIDHAVGERRTTR